MFSMSALKIFLVVLGSVLQQTFSRHLSLSLNMSMASLKPSGTSAVEVIEYCMKETQMTMNDLGRYRQQLIANDPNVVLKSIEEEERDQYTIDYDQSYSQQRLESLQCFAYCLYEQMGMIKNGVFTEHDVFRKLFMLIIEHEKAQVDECMNLSSDKPCETFYKMHVCYNKLKSIESERRIREIFDRQSQNMDYDQDVDDDDINSMKNFNSSEHIDFNMEKENEIELE